MPRVSVIIAAYNAEQHVLGAIESVRGQTEQDFEILVVDDASTDSTAERVAALAEQDDRIRLLRRFANGGPGAARNLGLAAARGEWIALLDADDLFRPDRLERLIALSVAFQADVVSDNPLLCEAGVGKPMLPLSSLPRPSIVTGAEYVAGNMGQRNKPRVSYGFMKPIVRRAFVEAHGIRYQNLRFSEDFLIALDCLIAGARWLVTPDALYSYTIRQGSLTESYSLEDVKSLILAYRETITRIPSSQVDLRRAAQRHLASIELSLSWCSFVLAVKRRRFADALSVMIADKRNFAHISKESVVTAQRAAGRLTASLSFTSLS
jgi:glycosyltransferase involved in cell wall biosynthesis